MYLQQFRFFLDIFRCIYNNLEAFRAFWANLGYLKPMPADKKLNHLFPPLPPRAWTTMSSSWSVSVSLSSLSTFWPTRVLPRTDLACDLEEGS